MSKKKPIISLLMLLTMCLGVGCKQNMNELRPKYHITAEKNWINDPNGLVKFNGKYHVFMQHHPYSLQWGPMHWAHVVSDDLLHWQHLPIALTPGDEFDKDGCFSGSSIVVNNHLYVVYTGFINNEDPEKIIQQQCMAYSDDGVNFVKLGCIIDKDKLPEGYASNDFRDPKIYKDGDYYYILVAARKLDGRGRILSFKSLDLKNWEFLADIFDEDSKGKMIECPDYVKNLELLIYCEQFEPVDGLMHHNVHSSNYKHGVWQDHKFICDNEGTVDYGFDFYAPQTFFTENVLIGWMDMWDRNQPSEQYGFAGQLTIPRRISMNEGRLVQTPVIPEKLVHSKVLNKDYKERVTTGFYKLEVEDLESLNVEFRKGKKHTTTFKFGKDEWVFDRSKSGVAITGVESDNDSLNGIRRMPYIKKDKHEIYFVLDEFSVEIFVDGLSLTSTIYPDQKDDLLKINVKAKSAKLLKHN